MNIRVIWGLGNPLEESMKKIFNLAVIGAMAGSMALMACSDNSTSASTSDDPQSSSSLSSSSSSEKKYVFSSGEISQGAQDNIYGKIKTSQCSGDMSRWTPKGTEALLIENDGSYQIEVRNVVANCGYTDSSFISLTGDNLNLGIIMSDTPMACQVTCGNILFNISAEEAAAKTVNYNGNIFKVVSKYSDAEQERMLPLTISTCKDDSFDKNSDDLSETTSKNAKLTKDSDGNILLTIPSVTANCGIDQNLITTSYTSKVDMKSNKAILEIELEDNSPQTNCICNFDMNFKLPSKFEKVDEVVLYDQTYVVEKEQAPTAEQTSTPAAEPKFEISSCKENALKKTAAMKAPASEFVQVDLLDEAEETTPTDFPEARLIKGEDGSYHVEIPDITENCGLGTFSDKITQKAVLNGTELVFSYEYTGYGQSCYCVFDFRFGITEEQAKVAKTARFAGKTYTIVDEYSGL